MGNGWNKQEQAFKCNETAGLYYEELLNQTPLGLKGIDIKVLQCSCDIQMCSVSYRAVFIQNNFQRLIYPLVYFVMHYLVTHYSSFNIFPSN